MTNLISKQQQSFTTSDLKMAVIEGINLKADVVRTKNEYKTAQSRLTYKLSGTTGIKDIIQDVVLNILEKHNSSFSIQSNKNGYNALDTVYTRTKFNPSNKTTKCQVTFIKGWSYGNRFYEYEGFIISAGFISICEPIGWIKNIYPGNWSYHPEEKRIHDMFAKFVKECNKELKQYSIRWKP